MMVVVEKGEDLVCGINAVDELLRRQLRRIQTLYCVEKPARRVAELVERARRDGVTIKSVPAAALDRLAGEVRHQGVAVAVAPFVFTPLAELLRVLALSETGAMLVAVDGVTDPRNLGAIIRTAAAAGAGGLLLPERRSAAITATVAKTAAGALENLPISRVVNLADALRRCQEAGFWVYGAASEGGQDIYTVEWADALVLVLGSEDKGLRPIVGKNCDLKVTIPLASRSESLNVGIAAAVTLFEINRSRRQTRNGFSAR
ncbi:MAG: 23S rRNA (guanosine(2251)-2'-O)-methyltransferase RlmB [Deltaproteobacteria bacterium]|nr:23S rRNA (guanosine(2251)-2'-O)-methyltransferase RlmB [Deltaproteobacteria bacterium]